MPTAPLVLYRIGVDSTRPDSPLSGTLPKAARKYGVGVKRLRRLGRAGAFPIYVVGGRSLVFFDEVEQWLRSTRVPVTSHAEARVAELLQREAERQA